MGPAVAALGPWTLLALALPVLYLLGRILRDLGKGVATTASADDDLKTWIDLLIPLGAALGVAVVIGSGGYGPGNYWDARFYSLLVPIGLMIYVLMVRLRAPLVIPAALAFLMAVSAGWSWKVALAWAQTTQEHIAGPVAALKKGQEPLSIWVMNQHQVVGIADPKQLLEYLLPMRATRRFVFRKEAPEPVPGMGQPLVRRAVTGRLSGGLHVVPDAQATGNEAVLADSANAGPGTVALDVTVPAAGTYHLCCRLQVPETGHTVTVQLDDGPAVDNPIPPAPDYRPYMLAPLRMTAGKHVVTLQVARPGLRLDLLEIIPGLGLP